MHGLIQTAAEVLKVSVIPLVIASVILVGLELVLIGNAARVSRSSAVPPTSKIAEAREHVRVELTSQHHTARPKLTVSLCSQTRLHPSAVGVTILACERA